MEEIDIQTVYLITGMCIAIITFLGRILWCIAAWKDKETTAFDMMMDTISYTFIGFMVGPLAILVPPILVLLVIVSQLRK